MASISKNRAILIAVGVLVLLAAIGTWLMYRSVDDASPLETFAQAEPEPLLRIVEPGEGQKFPVAQVYATIVATGEHTGQAQRVRVHLSSDDFETDQQVTMFGQQTTVSFQNLPDGTYVLTAVPTGPYDQPLFDQGTSRRFVVDADGTPNAVQDAEDAAEEDA